MYASAPANPSRSLLTEWPATAASPLVARRTPASMRRVVVFPAPSGPTRQNSSPRVTSNERSSTAATTPNRRVSPLAVTIGTAGMISPARRRDRGPMQLDVGRHARFELHFRVAVDLHFNPVDEAHALLRGLHALGRELRLRRDVHHAPGVALAGERIGADRRRVAEVDRADAVLRNEDAHPPV